MREFSQNHMILILQGLGWTVALTLAAMIFGGILACWLRSCAALPIAGSRCPLLS